MESPGRTKDFPHLHVSEATGVITHKHVIMVQTAVQLEEGSEDQTSD